jgi:Putative prokaryotic signal transducing protein
VPSRIRNLPPVDSAESLKLLFSASDLALIELVRKKLDAAGIKCEIRNQAASPGRSGLFGCPELWVGGAGDFLLASMLLGSWLHGE